MFLFDLFHTIYLEHSLSPPPATHRSAHFPTHPTSLYLSLKEKGESIKQKWNSQQTSKMPVRQKINKQSKECKNHKPTNKNKTPWSLICIGQLFLGLGPPLECGWHAQATALKKMNLPYPTDGHMNNFLSPSQWPGTPQVIHGLVTSVLACSLVIDCALLHPRTNSEDMY